MSLILCPECGAKISDKATQCPHCGFQSADLSRPISEQDRYEIFPSFEYDIEGWESNHGDLSVISYEDNKNLIKHLGNWNKIQKSFPAIAEVILARAQKEEIMVAKMDNYVKELIDKGIYRFTIDKNGDILPTIRDGKNIVKQIRLEKMSLPTNFIGSLNNIAIQASMSQILDEIEVVADAIRGIHIELQNDRLALADSARNNLKQAVKIQDSKLREKALLDVKNSATKAKCALMRNFSQNLHDVKEYHTKKRGKSDPSLKAVDALQTLTAITNTVQIECESYAFLGEYEPCKICLEDFKNFIIGNELDNKDTLLLLNEVSSIKSNEIVNKFSDISNKITSFDTSMRIEYQLHDLLTSDDEKGEDDDEPKQ